VIGFLFGPKGMCVIAPANGPFVLPVTETDDFGDRAAAVTTRECRQ
jgi:hypothetical protein